jgi:hypothetical protein
MVTVKNIEWCDAETGKPRGFGGKEFVATIEGRAFRAVKCRDSFYGHVHWDVYGECADVVPHGDLPLHYKVIGGGVVVLVECNSSGESPRITPCSYCRANRKVAR